MRFLLALLIVVALAWAGCTHNSTTWPSDTIIGSARSGSNSPAAQRLTITRESLLIGKVVTFNVPGRFVVVNFPLARMPRIGQSFSVYRQSLKVGEVRITGPQRDDNIVADITAGDATVGDEVRER